MAVALLAAGIGLLVVPGLTRRLGRRLPPVRWARLSLAALVGGAVAVELSAVLLAAPTVLRAAGVEALAAVCDRLVGPLVPLGPAAGWVAAVVAIVLPVLALRATMDGSRTQRDATVEQWLGEHSRFDGYDLVVLPTEEVIAFSVDGPHPQIVVSDGLTQVLPAGDLSAVLRHEVAHLRHGHQRYLVAVAAVERSCAVLPPVRWSGRAIRAALERWADEDAAREVGREPLQRALVGVTVTAIEAPVAAFSATDSIIERLEALAAPPRAAGAGTRVASYVPAVVLGAVAVVALGAWTADAQLVLAMAGRCPI